MNVILTSAILSTAASLARAQLQEVEPPQFGVRTLQVAEKINNHILKIFPVAQKYLYLYLLPSKIFYVGRKGNSF